MTQTDMTPGVPVWVQILRRGAVVFGLMSGCTSVGTQFNEIAPVGAHSSAVYVYRLASPLRGELLPSMLLDGRNQPALTSGGFLRREIPPGLHIVELRPGSAADSFRPVKLPFETKSGKTYFIRYRSVKLNGTTALSAASAPGTAIVVDHPFRYILELTDEATALQELAETRAIED